MDTQKAGYFVTFLILCAVVGKAGTSVLVFEETDVFAGGQDAINTYRIPSAICTRHGTVLVFCEGRRERETDGSPTHLVLKRSLGSPAHSRPDRVSLRGFDRGEHSSVHPLTWEPLQIIISSKGTEAFMNPVPVIDESTGVIFLLVNRFVHFGEEEDRGRGDVQTLLLKSNDEGATWSDPRDLTPSVGRAALGPGIGIQTREGVLAVPTYFGIISSDDHGKTWKAGGEISGPPNEAQVVELANGSLMLNLRGAPYRTVFISRDSGLTWGPPWKDPALTDPAQWGGCQASLIRFTRTGGGFNKNRLLFANPADPQRRFDLTVRLSYDEGKTWPVSKVVHQGPSAYSSMTIFPDGTVGLVYETGSIDGRHVKYNEKLTFAHFNLDWLTDGRDALLRTAPE